MEGKKKKKRMDEKDKRVWKEKKKRKNLWMKWNERGKKNVKKKLMDEMKQEKGEII